MNQCCSVCWIWLDFACSLASHASIQSAFRSFEPYYMHSGQPLITLKFFLKKGRHFITKKTIHYYNVAFPCQVGEDKDLSVMSTVELKKLFATKKVVAKSFYPLICLSLNQ